MSVEKGLSPWPPTRLGASVLTSTLYASPPFVLGIGVLMLSLIGLIELDSRIAPRRVLIASLVVYWVVASAATLVAWRWRTISQLAKRQAAGIAAGALSLGVSLAAAEYVARIVVARTHGFPLVPSVTLHHTSPANFHRRDNTGSFVHTNDDGLRTRWTRDTFTEQRERIAVIGDSFTFGLGVDDDKAAPQVLEGLLRNRLGRDDLAVLNAGTISWSPLLQRSAFRSIIRGYRPTVTLLLLDGTDIGDDYAYGREILPDSDPDDPRFAIEKAPTHSLALLTLGKPLLTVLQAPFVVAARLRGVPPAARHTHDLELEFDGVLETNRWFILRHPLTATRPYFETTLSYIRDIARDVEATGSKFMLVVTPRYFHWNDAESPNDWALVDRAVDEPYEDAYLEFFDAAAKTEEFAIVSLLPHFEATDRFPLVLHDDAHWNEDGNQFVAETLAELLLERGLLAQQ